MRPIAMCGDGMQIERDVVIYVPAYNCERTIVPLLGAIPAAFAARAEVLVIDNCSTDATARRVLDMIGERSAPTRLHLVRTAENIGYAGSQKLAYGLLRNQKNVRWVIMLHGDGQYPAQLLSQLVPFLESQYGVVYGYRSKRSFPAHEETPWHVWCVIKGLGVLESLVTRHWSREWHSGFVMYSTRFLQQVKLSSLTSTPHIDGHLQFAAGVLGEPVAAVPIYKRYKNLDVFEGAPRRRYVLDVLTSMFDFVRRKRELTGGREEAAPDAATYSLLSSPVANML